MENKKLIFLVIDDDPGDIEILRRSLEGIRGYNVELIELHSSKDMRRKLVDSNIDLIFIDYILGEETGIDVYRALRETGFQQPVIMLTGQGNEIIAVEAMKNGVADYITKGNLNSKSLCRAVTNALGKVAMQRKIEEQQKELAKLAVTDGLTGLYNRRHFMESMEKEIKRATRYKLPLCIMMLDLDHFKNINDTYGHLAGDNVLVNTAEVIKKYLRETDLAGRYGGEEFGIVVTNSGAKGAKILAERIRSGIAEQMFQSNSGQEFSVTCSIGLALFRDDIKSSVNALMLADEALYQAKSSGRNQVKVSDI